MDISQVTSLTFRRLVSKGNGSTPCATKFSGKFAQHSVGDCLSFVGSTLNHCLYSGWRILAKQDHLVCFLGGSLVLGATAA